MKGISMGCTSCAAPRQKKVSLLKRYGRFIYNGITRKSPVQVTLFITSRCNIRCKMCFYWEPVENSSSGEIKLEEIEKISKSMKPFFWLLIGGGEPFVRRDLAKIVKIFYENNDIRHVSIPSNATYENYIVDQLEEVLSECPDLFLNLNLSLNGLGKTHDDLCQTDGVFEKFLSTYKKMVELKAKYKNLGLGLNLTHSRYTQDELDKIIDFVVTDLPAIDNISLGLVRGRPKETAAMNVDIEYYKRAVERIEGHVVQNRLRSFQTMLGGVAFTKDMLMRRVIAKTIKSGYQIPCLAGQLSLVIDEKTNVYPCEMLGSVGNLRKVDYDMSKILEGDVLKTAVKKIKDDNCFCTHECSYSTNILFSYRLWWVMMTTFIRFKVKRMFKSANIFKSFDDLKLPRPHVKKQYAGQVGNLYQGKTFGVADEEAKTAKPARPF